MILSQELLAITQALEDQQIPYAVCGGFAVAIHGFPRMTYDLDVLILEPDVHRFEETVNALGFTVVSGTFAFRRGTTEETRFWRVTKCDGPDHLTLDALMVTPVFDEVWKTRHRAQFDGHEISVVSRDGLAIMKRLSGRTKDLADLEALGILPSDDEEPEPL